MDTSLSHRDEIVQTLNVLFEPGGVVELRAFNTKQGTLSGYYDDFQRLADDATTLDGHVSGLYVTANRCKRELLARSSNHLTSYVRTTTSDDDISGRLWLLIDVDPVRPSGISSSDLEHHVALERAQQIKGWLTVQGWPAPVEADSGNGGYLLYRIDLPNLPDAHTLVKSCLEALSFRFSDERVTIDVAVSNPGRLVRLFGTSNRKGDSVDDRPHRVSHLLNIPAPPVIVCRELLEQLAGLVPKVSSQFNGEIRELDVPLWLSQHGLSVSKSKPWQNATIYELKQCPFNPDHDRSSSVVQFSNGSLAFQCFHYSCAGNDWHALRQLHDPWPRTNRPKKDHACSPEWRHIEQLETPEQPKAVWPVLDAAALYGLPGEFVKAVSPYSEADPVALLAHVLAGAGSVIGADAFAAVEHGRHCARLNILCVGRTAVARKGTSWNTPKLLLKNIDPLWAEGRVKSGLSSGEGLIFHVRDEQYESRPIKENNRCTGEYEDVLADKGEPDKRLFIIEGEFAMALKAMERDGNTLSPILRDAWDHGDLSPLTKKDRMKATRAHITIVAHITEDELRRYLTVTERANGLANRFLYLLVKRAQLIPSGKGAPRHVVDGFTKKFADTMAQARLCGELGRDADAEALWAEMYPRLEEDIPGLTGAILGRGAAQALRLSLTYALLDEDEMKRPNRAIRVPHILAALAFWEFSRTSVFTIFGHAVGDPVADRLLEAIKLGPKTDTALYEIIGKHQRDRYRKDQALDLLLRLGRVHTMKEGTAGRPVRSWHYGQAQQCALCHPGDR